MRILPVAVAILLLCPTASILAQEPAWQETVSADGRLKVQLPGPVKKMTQDVNTPIGNLKAQLLLTELQGGKVTFGVAYSDYPDAHVQQTGAEKILGGAVDGLSRALNAKIDKDTKITLGKHPGREVQITGLLAGGLQLRATWRMYLVGNRLYQVYAIGIGELPNAGLVQKFHNSFALLPANK